MMMKRYIAYLSICLTLLLLNSTVFAQENPAMVYGTLVNNVGTPLQGITVILAESPAIKTITKRDGTFSINGQQGQHLLIKKADHLLKKVTIDQKNFRITINNNKLLRIPIGYGMTRSRDELTAAVGIARAEQLPVQTTILNPENLLFGKIPGLFVIGGGSGNLPANASMRIRGQETFRNSGPLILVDGFQHNLLRTVAPQAIKSVAILKDAAALAIYGQRGANGVILITTKRGTPQPLEVNVSLNSSITRPLGLPNMLGAPMYAGALNEALVNDGLPQRYSEQDIQAFKSGQSPYLYPNVDWFDKALLNHGTQSNFNVTFEGGGEVAQYFALLRFGHFNGLFRPSPKDLGYKTKLSNGTLNFQSNLDVNLTKNLLLKFDVSGYMYNIHHPHAGAGSIINALYTTPAAAFPVKLPGGTWGGTQIHDNPVALIQSTGFNLNDARQVGVDAVLQQDLDNWLEGLDVEIGFHYLDYGSYFENKNREFRYGVMRPVLDNAGNVIDSVISKFGQNTDLNYSNGFGNQLQFGALYGKVHFVRSYGDDRLNAMLLVQQNDEDYDGVNNVYRHRKIAANVHYGLNDTYFFNVAAAYAGRNLLPKGDRFDFFPAVSAAWLISNEDFLQNSDVFNRLKIRASWGIVGNDDIPDNLPFIRSYAYGGPGYEFRDDFEHQVGTYLPSIPATNFGVARSHKSNFGIEAGLFQHLELTADVFYAKRTNILVGSGGRYSNVIGIGTPVSSEGIVENKGMEAALTWHGSLGDFSYRIGGQFSYAKNKIINQNEVYRPYDYLKRTGRSIGQYFGLQAIGFFESEQDIANSPSQEFGPVKPGDIKYKDQNNDGVINDFDEIPIGYAGTYPEIYYSASVELSYKGLELSALFQGTEHVTAYLNTESVYWPLANNKNISSYYYSHRWTPQTKGTATLPRLTTVSNANNFRANSIWLEDASYLMLRYLTLSYTFPDAWIEPLHIDDFQVVLSGRNLFSMDNIPVGMPERYRSDYPSLKFYSLGLNFSF